MRGSAGAMRSRGLRKPRPNYLTAKGMSRPIWESYPREVLKLWRKGYGANLTQAGAGWLVQNNLSCGGTTIGQTALLVRAITALLVRTISVAGISSASMSVVEPNHGGIGAKRNAACSILVERRSLSGGR